MANEIVLTIGHSNHALEVFLGLLAKHRVSALADVRSVPRSGFNPHFNRGALAAAIQSRSIAYVYLGQQLGGRSDDPACYRNGRICYDRVRRTARFQDGIERVARGVATHRIALMCAEKEPLECHRTLLVAPALEAAGMAVAHILATGELESHAEAMERLLVRFNLHPDDDLFRRGRTRTELIAEAMTRQAARVAYVDGDLAAESSAGL